MTSLGTLLNSIFTIWLMLSSAISNSLYPCTASTPCPQLKDLLKTYFSSCPHDDPCFRNLQAPPPTDRAPFNPARAIPTPNPMVAPPSQQRPTYHAVANTPLAPTALELTPNPPATAINQTLHPGSLFDSAQYFLPHASYTLLASVQCPEGPATMPLSKSASVSVNTPDPPPSSDP
ncbi:hypothetical protein DFS34DRAFT_674306 [Phlyctochytrium arcticum]|nr:hypothetical protein DFS34DRAFT_674306 [Phlyctochytrium arcticum]